MVRGNGVRHGQWSVCDEGQRRHLHDYWAQCVHAFLLRPGAQKHSVRAAANTPGLSVCLPTVMTIAGSLSDFLHNGPSAGIRAAFKQSAGVLGLFAGCCAVMMRLYKIGVPPRLQLLSRWRNLVCGLVYAIVLVLHERPRKRVAK